MKKGKPAGQARVGEHLEFKKNNPHIVECYGAGATVTARTDVLESRAHPGINGKTLIDLITDNGTEVQWDQGTVTARFRRIQDKEE